jgi:hypothetical protein
MANTFVESSQVPTIEQSLEALLLYSWLNPKTGMWQLSGSHGYKADLQPSLVDMKSLVDAGFITFDLADHYGLGDSSPLVIPPAIQFLLLKHYLQAPPRTSWVHFETLIRNLQRITSLS